MSVVKHGTDAENITGHADLQQLVGEMPTPTLRRCSEDGQAATKKKSKKKKLVSQE